MRVAVLPIVPLGSGNTTLSMLVALQMSSTGKNVCITHTSPISKAYFQYLNLPDYDDRTCTPSQLVKLIDKGSINPEETHDYCKQATTNLEVFTNTSTTFTNEDMLKMHEHIATLFPHDSVIFDIDNLDITNEESRNNTRGIVTNCDVVVLTINQSVSDLVFFRDHQKEFISIYQDKPIVVVINKYHSAKMKLKEMAHAMGIKKPNNWILLHENPYVSWATNHGKLSSLSNKISLKDPLVVELNGDLTKILNTIMRANIARIRQTNAKNVKDKQKKVK